MIFIIMIAFLACYSIGVTFFLWRVVTDVIYTREQVNPHVEKLKNALLAFALLKVCKDDIDDTNTNYKSFDGSKLPMIAGFNTENKCFSYVVPKEEYENNIFHAGLSTGWASKIEAIEKYLWKNLGSDAKAMNFFVKYLDMINYYPSTKEETNGDMDTEMSDARCDAHCDAPQSQNHDDIDDIGDIDEIVSDNEYNIVEKKEV